MITLTDKASVELWRIISEKSMGDSYLRVGVRGGGCSGFTYTLGFDDSRGDMDIFFRRKWQPQDLKIVCDPKSFLFLNGMELDFEEDLMGRGFKFKNPNATNTCGCGESFRA